jgi:hypothetical protein
MERMDRARRVGGLAWVGAGLVFGSVRATIGGIGPGAITLVLVAATVVLAAVLLVPTPPRVVAVAGRGMAVLLAAGFAGAVADRFGLFGPPGAAGVSWGDWTAFVAYTRLLLHGVPEPVAVVAALGATAAEVVLALLLVTGWQRRWIGKAAAGLLTCYLLAMATSVGWGEVARYALPVEIGAALLVTVCPPLRAGRATSVDADTPMSLDSPDPRMTR